jgi:hypothetical protein
MNPLKLNTITECPDEGQGVNNWTIRAAWQLRNEGINAEKAHSILLEQTTRADSWVAEAEIARAIETVYRTKSKASTRKARPKWPPRQKEVIEAVLKSHITLDDFRNESPSNAGISPFEALNTLFPGDPLLCLGVRNDRIDTRSKSAWEKDIIRFQFIVPNPMTTRTGLNQSGRESRRCLANTGARRFLVVEQDPPAWEGLDEESKSKYDDEQDYRARQLSNQATILAHLNEYVPLACAVFSGSKSLHGWFFVEKLPEAQQIRFFRYCVQLGADPAMWTKCQFTRLPGGRRTPGLKHQTIYFINNDYGK